MRLFRAGGGWIRRQVLPRRFAALGLTALAFIGITGCGGGKTASPSSSVARSSGSSTTTVSRVSPGASRRTLARTKLAYEKKMQVLGVQLANSLDVIGSTNTDTPMVDAQNLQTAIPKLRAAAKKLAKIVPPPDVRAQHALLIKAVLELASDLKRSIALLQKGDLNALGDIYGLKGARDMEAASNNIEKMGYKIVSER